MDDAIFLKALSTHQSESSLIACRPNGLCMTNTRSEAMQFSIQNVETPPFQISVWETSYPPDRLFQLQSYSPAERRENSMMIIGESKQSRLIAFYIDNTGRCFFPYVHTYDGMKEEDNNKVHYITLDATTKHFKFRIDRGADLAYLLEQDFFKTAGYAKTFIRRISLTEVFNAQKTRRFEHTHIDGMPINSNWHLTNYDPIL